MSKTESPYLYVILGVLAIIIGILILLDETHESKEMERCVNYKRHLKAEKANTLLNNFQCKNGGNCTIDEVFDEIVLLDNIESEKLKQFNCN